MLPAFSSLVSVRRGTKDGRGREGEGGVHDALRVLVIIKKRT